MIRAVVVGASGYSGAELLSILLAHPGVRIAGLFGSARRGEGAPRSISEEFPRFRGRLDMPVAAAGIESIGAIRPDVVFLCTPHEASVELAPGLLDRGAVVIDLSAGFRLKDGAAYPGHYGFAHPRPDLLARAVYGLPEVFRENLKRASLIASPGCYPTSAILALRPLARGGAVRPGTRPIIDSTSGVSGAGRRVEQRFLFCEVSQQPYGVMSHRHQPEIDEYAGVRTLFTPHLGAYERGILSTVHVELAEGWNAARVATAMREAYEAEPFVRLCRAGVWPAVADVRGTNYCDLAWAVDEREGHAIVFGAIDNLVKGAAGQAVQAMNVRFSLDEAAGLPGAPR